MKRWQTTLANVIDYPQFHARLLNTLSLLEYIGARKIMKSQDETQISPITLSHMAEEIRHAQIIKKMAMKVGGSSVRTYAEDSLLCGREGKNYIQAIDRKAEEVLGRKESLANYLLTTFIIEERAQELYPLYDALLEPKGLSGPLKSIFREEVEHLSQVTDLLKSQALCTDAMIETVRQEEKKYFKIFFDSVDSELSRYIEPSPLELQ